MARKRSAVEIIRNICAWASIVGATAGVLVSAVAFPHYLPYVIAFDFMLLIAVGVLSLLLWDCKECSFEW